MLVEPVSKPDMEIRTHRLRKRVVGCVPDQQVTEAVTVVACDLGTVGTHELAADQCCEPRRHLRLVRGERLHASAVEDLAFHGAALEHAALGHVELVEPRCEQSLQRRRHVDVSILGRHGEHLRDKERIAACCASDPLAQLSRHRVADQRVGLLRGKWFELQHPGPARASLRELRPGHAHEQ